MDHDVGPESGHGFDDTGRIGDVPFGQVEAKELLCGQHLLQRLAQLSLVAGDHDAHEKLLLLSILRIAYGIAYGTHDSRSLNGVRVSVAGGDHLLHLAGSDIQDIDRPPAIAVGEEGQLFAVGRPGRGHVGGAVVGQPRLLAAGQRRSDTAPNCRCGQR